MFDFHRRESWTPFVFSTTRIHTNNSQIYLIVPLLCTVQLAHNVIIWLWCQVTKFNVSSTSYTNVNLTSNSWCWYFVDPKSNVNPTFSSQCQSDVKYWHLAKIQRLLNVIIRTSTQHQILTSLDADMLLIVGCVVK